MLLPFGKRRGAMDGRFRVSDGEDARHVRRALELAARGWGRVAPNPLVGAVIVRNGEVVGEGWHTEYGAPHAEVEAIRAAGERAQDATIYVSLEPCAHTGKTGPCTEAIRAAGIRRVVYAAPDPNPGAAGGGEALRSLGLEVLGGVEADAARRLDPAFHRAHDAAARRPWVELKLALSQDGRMADVAGRSAWITGEEARAEVHRLRAQHDAVAVGIGTALADDPRLTVRGSVAPRTPPVRVVFDRALRLPLEGRLVRGAEEVPVWAVCAPGADPRRREALEARGVRALEADDLAGALSSLRAAGLRSLFCEGGPRIAAALLRDDLADRLTLVYAPLFLGTEGADPFRDLPSPALTEAHRWRHLRTEALGADTLICLDR